MLVGRCSTFLNFSPPPNSYRETGLSSDTMLLMRTLSTAGLLALSIGIFGCGGSETAGSTETAEATEGSTEAAPGAASGLSTEGDAQAQIAAYAAANGIENIQFSPEGVGYVIQAPGEGEHPTVADQVKINYRGYLVDGQEFDSSKGTPVVFPLSNLIQAWQVAIPMIGRGGKIQIFAPPATAYGNNPPPGTSITANSVLVFDVELLDF